MPKIIPEPKRYTALSVVEQDRDTEKHLAHEEFLMISADDYEILRDYANLLEAKLTREHGDDITAEPARSYSELKKQFLSLRLFANAKSSQASFFRSVAEGLFGNRLVSSEENIESERKANAMLTNLLEDSEARCEALKKEVEALKSEMTNQAK